MVPALAVAALAACAGLAGDARDAAFARARDAGFNVSRVPAGPFSLVTFHRGLGSSPTLAVYLEGDGRAWITRRRLSPDPTPRNPVALELALRDPWPSVLYIARPCQFLEASPVAEGCGPRYWSSHRYADTVVAAVDAALERTIESVPEWQAAGERPRIGLVGYSGGGTLAALVAARRHDVEWLVTVAANLDHAAWTRLHRLAPLEGSLNPVDFVARLRRLPQLHLVGERDENVPSAILEAYLERLGPAPAARAAVVPGFDHGCCWQRLWPKPLERLRQPPDPAASPAASF